MERASREALDPSLRHKPRLISEEELPSWLLKDVDEVCVSGGCVSSHFMDGISLTTLS